jgi:hypothetical protein
VLAAKGSQDEVAALVLLLAREPGPEDEEALAADGAAEIVSVVGTGDEDLVHGEDSLHADLNVPPAMCVGSVARLPMCVKVRLAVRDRVFLF